MKILYSFHIKFSLICNENLNSFLTRVRKLFAEIWYINVTNIAKLHTKYSASRTFCLPLLSYHAQNCIFQNFLNDQTSPAFKNKCFIKRLVKPQVHKNEKNIVQKVCTVQFRFSDIKFNDSLWFSDYFAKNIFQFTI